MAIVISESRIVPVWLAALNHLEKNHRRYRNLLLEIEDPIACTTADKSGIDLVDAALREYCEFSVQTVAATIFPYRLYRKVGFEALPERFLGIMKRAKPPGTWGTYAMRLLERPGKAPGSTFNPLYQVIGKLRKASTDGVGYNSNYELGLHTPIDLLNDADTACEIPLYSPSQDHGKISNYPCLSHLTFKLIDRTTLELTAIYRSHYYAQRALGNLIGLAQLMQFVAQETGLQVGRLTCISTDAHLDFESWGGATNGQALLTRLNAIREASQIPAAVTIQSSEACEAG